MGSGCHDGRMRLVLLAALCLLLPACETGGHFTVLGYTTRPNYNTDIRTVRVPIFKNDTSYRDLEFLLTEALIREIEWKTPFKVVPAWESADSELTGVVVAGSKNMVLLNPLGEVRDAETTLTVQITWRDLRPGVIGNGLTNPLYLPNVPVPTPSPAGMMPNQVPDEEPKLGTPVAPYITQPVPVKPDATPTLPIVMPNSPPPVIIPAGQPDNRVLVQSLAEFRPELGESLASANDRLVKRMARQIVQMMEKPY